MSPAGVFINPCLLGPGACLLPGPPASWGHASPAAGMMGITSGVPSGVPYLWFILYCPQQPQGVRTTMVPFPDAVTGSESPCHLSRQCARALHGWRGGAGPGTRSLAPPCLVQGRRARSCLTGPPCLVQGDVSPLWDPALCSGHTKPSEETGELCFNNTFCLTRYVGTILILTWRRQRQSNENSCSCIHSESEKAAESLL